ncbi:TPA: hypothetical protein OUB33_002691 [Staphylococcus aureus]|nr:hypothetical protein [Staphylococcus aureus]
MFKKNNNSFDSGIIKIYSIQELEFYLQSSAKTLQEDFGAPWSYASSAHDDRACEAMIFMILQEFGFRFVSEDKEVQKFIKNLTDDVINKKFVNYLTKGSNSNE